MQTIQFIYYGNLMKKLKPDGSKTIYPWRVGILIVADEFMKPIYPIFRPIADDLLKSLFAQMWSNKHQEHIDEQVN